MQETGLILSIIVAIVFIYNLNQIAEKPIF